MSRGWLTTLLGLLSAAWLPPGSGRPGPPAPPGPAFALGSWKAFLGLQKPWRLGTDGLQDGQEVATSVSLPLDPKEVTQEMCKAVPFIQVSVWGGGGPVSAPAGSPGYGSRQI
ncbi:Hypothetical predicted protein [Marmota monax]|uniref:Uncharacterized protein n=1 Tax=Marmota monax TaxID=9995 RepID=A0A5E4A9Y4_MARMO|nr:hypothetical protein GHT09_004121 [Marmota monax]VTJ53954.1 Hypothetical predicted protein [Marmota monax]